MKPKEIRRKKEIHLSEKDIRPENVKWNVTIRMPGDLIEAYKREAAKLGIGYQTLMQLRLREGIDNSMAKRITALEKKIRGV